MAGGEDFIDVLLHGPGCAHPPAWHLVDDHVGPEKLGNLCGDVITLVDPGLLDITTGAVEIRQGGFMQGRVVATGGVGERLAAVE